MNENGSKDIRGLSRRGFLAGMAGAAALGAGLSCSSGGRPAGEAIVPKKKLGSTEIVASIIGMGWGSALNMVKDDQEALALIDLARRKGINFFDSSANYGPASESRFGEALEPHRKEVYLSTKYESEHSPDQVMRNFETSLKRFRTDYIDVAHLHSVKDLQEVETMFSSGALETLVKLKEQGLVRYLGVTSHNHPPAMAEALRRFDFDICFQAANASKVPFLFEFDPVAENSFEDLSLPLANSQGLGVFSFKITGQHRLIRKGDEPGKAPVLELIRYGLSLPVHGILLGMNKPEHVTSACELAANFTPMTQEEMRDWNLKLAPSANELTLHYLRRDYVDDGGPRPHLS